jgi:membrane protease YdiL (CAAX protease family)
MQIIPTSPSDPLLKVALPAAALLFLFIVCKIRRISADDLLLKRPGASEALLWLALYVGFMLSTDYLLNWRGNFDFTIWRNQPLFVSACRIVAVAFLGPIAEELIFRGLIFLKLQKIIPNPWVRIALISLAWALIHLEYCLQIQGLIFVEGLLLGAAMLKSRSLYLPMVLHIIWNLYAI